MIPAAYPLICRSPKQQHRLGKSWIEVLATGYSPGGGGKFTLRQRGLIHQLCDTTESNVGQSFSDPSSAPLFEQVSRCRAISPRILCGLN